MVSRGAAAPGGPRLQLPGPSLRPGLHPGTACRVSRALSCCEVGPRFPSGLPAPQPVVRRRGGARRGRRAPPAAGLPLPPKTESVAVSGSPLALVLSVQRRRRFPEVVSPCACGLPGPGSVTDPGLSRLPRPPWVLFVLSACVGLSLSCRGAGLLLAYVFIAHVYKGRSDLETWGVIRVQSLKAVCSGRCGCGGQVAARSGFPVSGGGLSRVPRGLGLDVSVRRGS